jgi:hypothetical protein
MMAPAPWRGKVYVTPDGRPAIPKTLSGDSAAGATRRLDIQLSAAGEVRARLD